MNIPTEILYKIAEESDDYIKTLKSFRIEPRVGDYKYVFKNVLKDIEEIDENDVYSRDEDNMCCNTIADCVFAKIGFMNFIEGGGLAYRCRECKSLRFSYRF